MKEIKADICVIGAGSGGLSVAAGAAQMGARTVLIEKHKMGGDCLNTGCVPSKALIAAAKHAYHLDSGHRFNQPGVDSEIDYAQSQAHVAEVIETIEPHDSVERFEGLGVEVIKGHAKFISPHKVETENVRVRAKKFVIATGSSPFVPPIKGLPETPHLTNETMFDNHHLPKHLLVIGGGPIGLEMAHAHRRLGSKVTVFEGSSILPKDDPDLVEVVRQQLLDEGVVLKEGAMVEEVSGSTGEVAVTCRHNGNLETVRGSHILVATGRRPSVAGLELEDAEVKYSDRGIEVDARLRTNQKHIFAIGDVTGGLQFTHVAGYEAGIVIRNALFKLPAKAATHHVPWVTYTDPEIGHVGLSESAAREKFGDKIKVLRSEFSGNDRAVAEKDTRGHIKVITSNRGKILGASIVGTGAGEIINQWSLAISAGLKISAMASYIAPYPTRSEISKRAAGEFYTPTLYSGKTRFLVKLLSKFG